MAMSRDDIFKHVQEILGDNVVTAQRLSGLIATDMISAVCPRNSMGEDSGCSAVRSHSRAVPSQLPVMSQRLSGLIANALTRSSCPLNTRAEAAMFPAFRS